MGHEGGTGGVLNLSCNQLMFGGSDGAGRLGDDDEDDASVSVGSAVLPSKQQHGRTMCPEGEYSH